MLSKLLKLRRNYLTESAKVILVSLALNGCTSISEKPTRINKVCLTRQSYPNNEDTKKNICGMSLDFYDIFQSNEMSVTCLCKDSQDEIIKCFDDFIKDNNFEGNFCKK